VSIQDVRQNPQDTSNFYLANIYQAISDPNRSNISSSLPTSPPPFSPPTYAVWVNSLWFLSLVISITCALLATLLQQWARRYLKVTQTRSSLHKRARIRSFFAEGIKKSHLAWVVEALPTLIHVSVSLFFVGLVVFLWNVNLTIFKLVLSWICVCTAFYGCITFVPIFLRDSPYYSPLTPLARPVVVVILFVFAVLYFFFYLLIGCCAVSFNRRGSIRIFSHLTGWLFQDQDKFPTPEEAALKSSSETDTRALMWTFDSLDEDHELERFFSDLPGFHNSKVLKQPLHSLYDHQKLGLLEAAIRLLDRTYSSNLLSDQLKRQRADICAGAIDLVDTPDSFLKILYRLASEDGYGPLQSTKTLHFVRRQGDRKRKYSTPVRAIFSIVVARVQQHDDSWFILASDELGMQETVLREHAARGDNLSFAILIYVTRQQFSHIGIAYWPDYAIMNILEAASKFNVEDTSPELQHEFCALWNQAVRKAQNDGNWEIAKRILKPIRHVYIRLHRDTNSAPTLFSASMSDANDILDEPDSYPVCVVTGHVHGNSASTTIPRAVQHDNAATSPASRANSIAPSLPLPSPSHIDESLRSVPPFDNSHPTHQSIESLRIPITSPDQAIAGAIQDFVASGITTSSPTPETFISAPPRSSTTPLVAVPLQHNADSLTPSDSLNLSPSASTPVLDNILLGESHRPLTGLSAPSASLVPIFGPDLGTSVEGDCSSTPAFRKGNDAVDPPSVDHLTDANALPTPQSPPLPSATDPDVAIVGRSLRGPNAEHDTGGHPPGPSPYQYDIV
jgi:hypothetical protein